MLLQRLVEYGRRLDAEDGDERLPPMYQRVPIRYVIQLDREGRLKGIPHVMVDTRTDKAKRGVLQVAPTRVRTLGVAPKLLVDNAEYVLGISRNADNPGKSDKPDKPEKQDSKDKLDRVRRQHASFVELIGWCETVTGEPTITAVRRFLATLDVTQFALPADFDPTCNITFDVEGVNPAQIASVQAFWAREASTTSASDGDNSNLPCLVCGQVGPVVDILPVRIQGIPGGQSSGMALVSANAVAFESYGLHSTHTSPICEACGILACNALNRLLRQGGTHLSSNGLAFVFWTGGPADLSWATLLANPEPEDLRRFLETARRGAPGQAALAERGERATRAEFAAQEEIAKQDAHDELDSIPFYAATLSASNSRVVVRDWIETTLGDAQRALRRYFRLQRLVDGVGEDRFFPFWQLQRATVKAESRQEQPAPQVGQALMSVALRGGPVPEWLLYQAVRFARLEQGVSTAQAALIKMVLLTQGAQGTQETQETQVTQQSGTTEQAEMRGPMPMGNMDATHASNATHETDNLTALDPQHPAAAYHCGRLLAELEAIQRATFNNTPSATIVTRYYNTASSAPDLVFPRLLRGAQQHLLTLRSQKPGLWYLFDERLRSITSHLEQFPQALTLREQGLFALGYYHQRAADGRETIARRQGRTPIVAAGHPTARTPAAEEEFEVPGEAEP